MVKISKVDHIRAAQVNGNGLLYGNRIFREDKKKWTEFTVSDSTSELISYVKERKESAQKLYKIFNEKAGKASGDPCIGYFSSFFDELVQHAKREDVTANQILNKICKKKIGGNVDAIKNHIDDCLRASLRQRFNYEENSARKTGSGVEAMKQIAEYLCESTDAPKSVYSPELRAFIEMFIRDVKFEKPVVYNGTVSSKEAKNLGRLSRVPDSIYHQNIKVIEKDGILALSSKKKWLAPFMASYACANQDGKNKLLEEQRKLLAKLIFGTETDLSSGSGAGKVSEFGYESLDKFIVINDQAKGNFTKIENNEVNSKSEKNSEKEKEYYRLNRILREENDALLKDSLYKNFRDAKDELPEDDKKKVLVSLLEHFLDMALPRVVKNPYMDEKDLTCIHLCHMVWSQHIAFIREKYTDLGKAVYHFVIPEEVLSGGQIEGIRIKEPIPDRQPFGLSSFGYEYLKAEESLQKELALYIQFAANTFARAVFPAEYLETEGQEDALFNINREYFKGGRKDLKESLLRYFGGASRWKDFEFVVEKDNDGNPIRSKHTFAIKKCLWALRNQSFHYTGKFAIEKDDIAPVRKLFKEELKELGNFYRDRFNSNNVYMFYSRENSVKLLESLYQKSADTPAQIPSFKKLFPRKDMTGFQKNWLSENSLKAISDSSDRADKFQSCLYFLFKEIYYNKFLTDPRLPYLFFKKAMEQRGPHNRFEVQEFKTIVKEKLTGANGSDGIKKFGGLCQFFVSEYDRQNHETEEKEDLVYKNYPLLMHKCLKEVFVNYVKNNFSFLREAVLADNGTELTEKDWPGNNIKHGINTEDDACLVWYVAARFLIPEYVNKLAGEFSKYNQFVADILERFRSVTGNDSTKKEDLEKRIEDNKKIIRVLHFVSDTGSFISRANARGSQKVKDYFKIDKDNNTYVRALRQYVSEDYDIQEEEADSEGIYYDGKEYKPNRNIIFSSMYGAEGILPGSMEKVTKAEIEKYRGDKKKYQDIFLKQLTDPEKGRDTDKIVLAEDEQKALRDYQDLKNRVELTDVLTFSKMVNDLMAQLIVWAYLRERDKMYFQLGYHYIRLFSPVEGYSASELFHSISAEDGSSSISEGAILYEIAAVYNYNMPLFKTKAKNDPTIMLGNAGLNSKNKEKSFKSVYPEEFEKGLELFKEDVTKADENEMDNLRKTIDHFKYFNGQNKSILELYSEAYDSFLAFSTNYKKSVPLVLTQILEDYKVRAAFKIEYTKEKIDDEKEKASILPKYEQFKSEGLTFKVLCKEKDGRLRIKDKQFNAHSETFLTQVMNILKYPEKIG